MWNVRQKIDCAPFLTIKMVYYGCPISHVCLSSVYPTLCTRPFLLFLHSAIDGEGPGYSGARVWETGPIEFASVCSKDQRHSLLCV